MITFDAGALVALERKRDRMLRVVRAAQQTATAIVIPAAALAEWWRGPPSARMANLLEGVTIEPVDDALARMAGDALAAVARSTVVDALVMASAARRGGVVYTSDLDDLVRLTGHFREVRVVHV